MTLTRRTPLSRRAPIRASKLPDAPPRSRERRSPPRSPAFLHFVRSRPCFYCGTTIAVEAHHWGRRGMGQKCSDWETVPLCRVHHAQWHSEGSLPGSSRAEWLEAFAVIASKLRRVFEARQGRKALMR